MRSDLRGQRVHPTQLTTCRPGSVLRTVNPPTPSSVKGSGPDAVAPRAKVQFTYFTCSCKLLFPQKIGG